MADKNNTPARAKGVFGANNPNPGANLPANNSTDRAVKLGAGQKSAFAKPGNTPSHANAGNGKGKGATVSRSPHMPTHNEGSAKVNLGNTKHGVGQVPGYLKGKEYN